MAAIEPAVPGERLLSIPLVRQLGGNSEKLLDVIPADGRFHLIFYDRQVSHFGTIFAIVGILASQTSPIHRFSKKSTGHLGPFQREDITSTYRRQILIMLWTFSFFTPYYITKSNLSFYPNHFLISGPLGCMKMSMARPYHAWNSGRKWRVDYCPT
jgi:hypothetical protein